MTVMNVMITTRWYENNEQHQQWGDKNENDDTTATGNNEGCIIVLRILKRIMETEQKVANEEWEH